MKKKQDKKANAKKSNFHYMLPRQKMSASWEILINGTVKTTILKKGNWAHGKSH